MVLLCCVPGCGVQSGSVDEDGEVIKLFRPPPEISFPYQYWITIKCKLEDVIRVKKRDSVRVCSLHFQSSQLKKFAKQNGSISAAASPSFKRY